MEEQIIVVNAVMLYLQPHLIKQLDVYANCTSMFKTGVHICIVPIWDRDYPQKGRPIWRDRTGSLL